jgi:hypothetical protein
LPHCAEHLQKLFFFFFFLQISKALSKDVPVLQGCGER